MPGVAVRAVVRVVIGLVSSTLLLGRFMGAELVEHLLVGRGAAPQVLVSPYFSLHLWTFLSRNSNRRVSC